MFKHTNSIWFGTEESYIALARAWEQVQALEAQGADAVKAMVQMRGGGTSGDPFALPPLLDIQGSVGVINISGSLVNGEAGFMRLFGITGYGDIQAAMLEAYNSKDVKSILLSIDSGGGAVSGLEDAGNMIRKVAETKPVTSYSDGSMGSAAYWIGASADKILAAKTAQVGSVGTLIVHTEISKKLAADGVTKTMVRYGDFKALANPYEPLTPEAKAELQSLANEAGQIFVDYAAERRNTTPEKFQATMGEGRVFMGKKAQAVGLTDGTMNYESAFTYAKSLDTKKTPAHNSRNSSKDSAMKANLSKLTLLAIAAGSALTSLGLDKPEANAEGSVLDAAAQASLLAEATEVHAAFTAATAKAVEAAVTTAKADTKVTTEKLEADLKAATDKVTILETATTGLTSKVTAADTIAASYAGVVKASISVMSIALGGAADVGAALVGPELYAEHERLKEAFTKKFPKGGVAAVNMDFKPEASVKAPPPAAFLALLKPVKA